MENHSSLKGKSISELFMREFSNYKLIKVNPRQIHDRNLRIDDKMFLIATGADRAGEYPTNFLRVENAQEARTILERYIVEGEIIHESSH